MKLIRCDHAKGVAVFYRVQNTPDVQAVVHYTVHKDTNVAKIGEVFKELNNIRQPPNPGDYTLLNQAEADAIQYLKTKFVDCLPS